MTNEAHNEKIFPAWEQKANERNAKGVCVVCHDTNNKLHVMGLSGIPMEAMVEILEAAIKTIQDIPKKPSKKKMK